MEDDKLLPKGLRFFNPHDSAPDFVVGTLIISLNELVTYCKENADLLTDYKGVKQLNVQLLISRGDKLYGKVNDYKKEEPKKKEEPAAPAARRRPGKAAEKEVEIEEDGDNPDDLPF